MGVRVFNSCVVLLTLIYVFYGFIDAAAINGNPRAVGAFSPASKTAHLRSARQAYSDEDGSEEEAEVQAEQFAQQQLLQQQASESQSQEESEEDGEDDDNRRRRRRRETPAAEAEKLEQLVVPIKEAEAIAVPEPVPVPAPAPATSNQTEKETLPVVNTATATVTATPSTPSRNTSVLILIRDALKKVTTLPTEQVATNALQYFQLFEHFIQKTIEEVIGDDDDDDDDASAAGAAVGQTATTIKPDAIFTPEEEELIAGVEEILKGPELVTKQPPKMKPDGIQNQAPVESDAIVGSTKPAPGGPTLEAEQEAEPAIVAEPAKVEPVTNSV